ANDRGDRGLGVGDIRVAEAIHWLKPVETGCAARECTRVFNTCSPTAEAVGYKRARPLKRPAEKRRSSSVWRAPVQSAARMNLLSREPGAHPMPTVFDTRTDKLFDQLREQRVWKTLQVLESPMDAVVKIRGYGECVCFCSNNYLGLANHPEVVEAGLKG